jgi:hypothetical protein
MERFVGLRPNSESNGLFLQSSLPLEHIDEIEGIEDFIKDFEEI